MDLGIHKSENSQNLNFLAAIEPYRNDYTFVYTDASKTGTRVGYGIHIPQINFDFSSRLPNQLSICTAEVVAIYEALRVVLKKNINNVIILSDSQGAIAKIKKRDVHPSRDYLSLKTKRLLHIANSTGSNIAIAWIPGHSQIVGNERVDTLARIGSNLNVPLKVGLDRSEVVSLIREEIMEEHDTLWRESLKLKGTFYASIVPVFPRRKWFLNFGFVDLRHITTIIRMRTGHCLNASHLYKIKINADPRCECGMEESLNHIFFECPINFVPGFDMYWNLVRSGLLPPLNISLVLANLSEDRIRILIRFLQYNKIKL